VNDELRRGAPFAAPLAPLVFCFPSALNVAASARAETRQSPGPPPSPAPPSPPNPSDPSVAVAIDTAGATASRSSFAESADARAPPAPPARAGASAMRDTSTLCLRAFRAFDRRPPELLRNGTPIEGPCRNVLFGSDAATNEPPDRSPDDASRDPNAPSPASSRRVGDATFGFSDALASARAS
jgi:hypothetical protein